VSDPAQPPSPQIDPALKRLILVLGAAGFASTFTMRAFDPLVPTIALEFGQSIQTTASVATAFSIAYAIGQPFLGPVADNIGKVRTINISLFLLAGLSVLVAIAWGFGWLVAARALTGVVAGGIIPVAMAAIGDRAPMADRQVLLGRFLVIMIVGQMAGAAFSGLVAEHFGWRAVFLLSGAVAAITAVLVAVVVKPRSIERQPLSLTGALAGYRIVLANPRTKLLLMLVIIEGSLVFGITPYVAAILEQRTGAGPAQAGLVIGGAGLGGIIYGFTTRFWMKHLGPARMTVIGGCVMGIACLLFSLPLPWWTGIAFFTLQGFGFFLMHGTFQAQATELAPDLRGSAMALFACALFCGHALGPLIMGGLSLIIIKPMIVALFGALITILGFMTPRILPLDTAKPRV
jgi:MFS transporter, YNFM family, putative membrane transport protein